MSASDDALSRALVFRASADQSRPSTAPALITDEELLAGIVNRDRTALSSLFERYAPLALAIGSRILRDRAEAEDLVQDIFLDLFRKPGKFDPALGSGRSWLVRVMYRRALDRRAYLERRHFYSGTELDDVTNVDMGNVALDQTIIRRLSSDQLRAELPRLQENQRVTLELYFFQGLTLREIGEQRNEELANVRHHYYRGLEALRRIAAGKGGL